MQLPLFSGQTPRPGASRARGPVGHCTSGRPLNPPLLLSRLIRPPVYGSNRRSYKMLVMFFFRHAFSEWPVPSTDRPETLPPDRNLRLFYNASPKIRGPSPKKLYRLKNFGRFWTTSDFDREYLRNGFRYPKSAGVTNYGNSSCV